MIKISRQEKFQWIGFNDSMLRLIAVPLFSFFFPILVMGIGPFENFILYMESFLISFTHTLLYWEFDRYIVIRLRKKYQLISEYKKRIIVQTALIVGSTILFCVFSNFLQFCFTAEMGRLKISLVTYITASLIITSVILSIYEARFAFTQWKNGLLKYEQLQKENAQAQLEVLRGQVNPHFFFNSINTLISVIPEDPKTAVTFAQNLSNVYRCILEMKDKEMVTLTEEMNCVHAYKYLLKIRFGDHLTFQETIANQNENLYIVPLSIQMLIENAIKHNVASSSRPLEIRIEQSEDWLSVSNNLQPKLDVEASTKIGLENINKRYEILVNKQIVVTKTKDVFRVQLPILKMDEVS